MYGYEPILKEMSVINLDDDSTSSNSSTPSDGEAITVAIQSYVPYYCSYKIKIMIANSHQ